MDFTAARAELVTQLQPTIRDRRVIEAIGRIPRELFVPPEQQKVAYENNALPIGFGQTISQPYMVAKMTEALSLGGTERVLEVGTGSGYQAAVLAELAQSVLTTERIMVLAEIARATLAGLGYKNINVQLAGKTLGWPEEAPYDAILVSAGAPCVPPELLVQLATAGRLVIPVGPRHFQKLYKITRQKNKVRVEELGGCFFVPLIGKGAWEK